MSACQATGGGFNKLHTNAEGGYAAAPPAPAVLEPNVVTGPARDSKHGPAWELDLSGRPLGDTLAVVLGSLLRANPEVRWLMLASMDMGRR